MTLIEKLRAATGPSRELDRRIFLSITGGLIGSLYNGSKITSIWEDRDGYGCNTEDGWRHEQSHSVAHYTSSLDAALTLVPEPEKYNVSVSRTKFGYARADIWEPYNSAVAWWAEAKTMPNVKTCPEEASHER